MGTTLVQTTLGRVPATQGAIPTRHTLGTIRRQAKPIHTRTTRGISKVQGITATDTRIQRTLAMIVTLRGPTLGPIQIATGRVVVKNVTLTPERGRGTDSMPATPFGGTGRSILVTILAEKAIVTGLD